MRLKLTIAFMIIAALVGTWQMSTQASAQQALTLAMVLTGLQTQGRDAQTNTLAKRNIYIANKVKTYGVTFRLTTDIERELRNAGATTVLIETVRRYGPSAPTPTPTQAQRPYATFKDLWIDYDVKQGGLNGMKIHAKFTAYRMRGVASYLAIYFKDKNGNYLKDKNGKMASGTNDVAVYQELDPCCEPTDYNDLTVFMPYNELDLPDGKYTLTMDVKIIYKAGGVISPLTEKSFSYSQEDNSDWPDSDDVTTEFRRAWVDYGVTVGGRKGMRVHANFQVTGLKGYDSLLRIRIARQNNEFVGGKSSDYNNSNDEFQAQFELAPGYETTDYKDISVFIPYDEIDIERGKHNLKLDIDVTNTNGDKFKHLTFYEFEFTQR